MTPELHRLADAFQAELANTNAALDRLERLIRAATRICPDCDGRGWFNDWHACPECDGTGEVEASEETEK